MSKKIIMDKNTTFNISKKLSTKQLEILLNLFKSPGLYRRFGFSGGKKYHEHYALTEPNSSWTLCLGTTLGYQLTYNPEYTTHTQIYGQPFRALFDYGLITFNPADPTIIIPTPFAKEYLEYHGL